MASVFDWAASKRNGGRFGSLLNNSNNRKDLEQGFQSYIANKMLFPNNTARNFKSNTEIRPASNMKISASIQDYGVENEG